MLYEEILSVELENEYKHVICGDMNARWCGLIDYIVNDGIEIVDENAEWYFDSEKESKFMDKEQNLFGRSMVNFCIVNNIHNIMLNGMSFEDKDGGFTCITPKGGKSTVRYIMCSTNLFNKMLNLCKE